MKGQSEPLALEVAITTTDASVLRGWIVAGITGKLDQTLNKDAPFLEFVAPDGRRTFLSKKQIASVQPVEPLRKPTLNVRQNATATCYEVLGVPENCNFHEAKDAYHRLVKAYHPDLYANPDFPAEVVRYATEMFSQVSSAFSQIREKFGAAA